jgi:hypothetical protein
VKREAAVRVMLEMVQFRHRYLDLRRCRQEEFTSFVDELSHDEVSGKYQ